MSILRPILWQPTADGANRALSNLAAVAINTALNFDPGGDQDMDLITVGVTGTPKLWWDEATDSFEMNKGLTLPGGSLKIGGFVIQEDTVDNDGLKKTGSFHVHANGGVSGNICFHEGTEPTVSASGDGHRMWVDASHNLKWQNESGVSVGLASQGDITTHAAISSAHHARYADAEAVAAVENEATLTFKQPTIIATGVGAGALTLGTNNSLIFDPSIDVRCKNDFWLYDNKKLWLGTTKDYWFEYNTSGSRLRCWTKDGDGIGTDMVWMRILDGTIDPQFMNAIEVDTINEFTAAAGVTLDSVLLKDGLVDGRDVAADGGKLDGIETAATADQTNAEIKTAYEANADTNEFSDAEQTKLTGIATGAEVSTKEVFVPAGSAVLASNASFQTDHVTLPDAVTIASCWFTMRIPNDFNSRVSGYPKVVFTQGTGGTGNFRVAFTAYATAVGEQVGDTTDSIVEYSMAAGGLNAELWEEDISAAFNGLALNAGDYISLRIDRDSDDAADTFVGDLDVMGVVMRYV